jgi:hypothetical protein
MLRKALVAGALANTLAACGSDEPTASPTTDPNAYLSELEAVGLFKYLGKFSPSSEEVVGDMTQYWFDVTPEGPQCFRGGRYGLSTRAQGSDNLVIYLAGGGACWTGFDYCTQELMSVAPTQLAGVIDPSDTAGPTGSWNHAYLPYCDGSIFIGDRRMAPDRIHFGLKNLSAALDTVKADFPSPKRILLAGSSAGGFGTIWATGIVRKLYPTAELLVFNDAGVGISKPDEPGFRQFLEAEWGAEDRMPASCSDCETSAHTLPLVAWGLEHDTSLVNGVFSSYADTVVAGTFLGYADNPSIFTDALLAETGKIHQRFPDRYRRFFIEGGQHTALDTRVWGSTQKNGVTVKDWTIAMLTHDAAAWIDMP